MAIKDGDFYINNANQDFFLREAGIWVRKGNIRDEGSSGLIGIQPIISTGFNMAATVQRIRYLGSVAMDFGFTDTVTVDRIRALVVAMNLGVNSAVDVQRIRLLTAEVVFGFNQASALARTHMLSVAMDLGFDLAAVVMEESSDVNITANMNLGFDTAADVHPLIRLLTASMSEGFSMASPLSRTRELAITAALGFDMAATVSRIKPFSAGMGFGFSTAAALSRSRAVVPHPLIGFNMAATVTHVVPVVPATTTYDIPSQTSFLVPNYNTLTIEIWGGGAGGNGVNTGGTEIVGSNGNGSVVLDASSTLILRALGGNAQLPGTQTPAVANVGNSTLTSGNTTATNAGSGAPNGGGDTAQTGGLAGTTPGGGGEGSRGTTQAKGGNSGAYAKAIYTKGVTAGAPVPGDTLACGGNSGGSAASGTRAGDTKGGAGSPGRTKFTVA